MKQQAASSLLTFLLAFGLRVFRLGAESLWYDETVSVFLAGKDVVGLVAHTARDIHPPGYYLLLHFWQGAAGRSDFSAAFLSLSFGMLLVALAHRMAGRLFGRRAAVVAALLVAISPYNVWYSQEVRMYTLGAVLAMGVVGATLHYWQARAATGKKGGSEALVVYTVCAALGLWSLYYFVFLLVAVNLFVAGWWPAAWRRRSAGWGRLGWWALAQVGILLLYAPWVPIAWRQATNPPVPPWRSFTGAWDVLVQTWTALGLGQSAEVAWGWPALLVLAGLVGLGLVRNGTAGQDGSRPRERRMAAWFLIASVLVPVMLIYLASFVTPLFHVRYVFTYSTPFYVVAAAGAAWLWRRWATAGVGALVVVAFLSCISLIVYHVSPRYAADDHRAAAAFLADEWRPGDAIVVNAGYAYLAVLTYWPESGVEEIAWRGRLTGDAPLPDPCAGPALLTTGTVDGDPDLGWGDPASDFYAMTRPETEEALERLFATYHRVWIYRIYDTVADPRGFVRDWLEEQGTPFVDRVFTGESQLRVQGYLTGLDPLTGACPAMPAAEPVAGGALTLAGLAAVAKQVEVGGVLDLAAVWQAGTQPPEDAYLFAGLFDDQGGRWAQVDEQPAGPLFPTGEWGVGEMVRTPLRLRVPASTPPGTYRIELGWYRFEAGQPVWLPWRGGDRLLVEHVDVVPPAAGWASLSTPQPSYSAGVNLGQVRFLGFDAPVLEGQPGDALAVDLYWQGGEAQAEAAPGVLRLVDGEGVVVDEWVSAPADGRAPFPTLAAGQVVRDPRTVSLAATLEPGMYGLELGRRTSAGEWLAVRRGPVSPGPIYPLATVRVLGRTRVLVPPTPQHSRPVTFGPAIRFLGYDLDRQSGVELRLYWQSIEPVTLGFKIAVHLLGGGGPGDIRAQADVYPHLATTSWLAGEYLVDEVKLDLPAGVKQDGTYTLWLALYDEATGARLPVYGEGGMPLGDGLVLDEASLGE